MYLDMKTQSLVLELIRSFYDTFHDAWLFESLNKWSVEMNLSKPPFTSEHHILIPKVLLKSASTLKWTSFFLCQWFMRWDLQQMPRSWLPFKKVSPKLSMSHFSMILWCPTNHAECKLMQCACCILYPELVPCYDSSASSAACFCSYFYAFDHPFHSFDLRPPCFWALSSFPCHPSWNLWEARCDRPTVANADTPRRRPSRFCSDHWSAWSPVRMRCPPSCATPAL